MDVVNECFEGKVIYVSKLNMVDDQITFEVVGAEPFPSIGNIRFTGVTNYEDSPSGVIDDELLYDGVIDFKIEGNVAFIAMDSKETRFCFKEVEVNLEN